MKQIVVLSPIPLSEKFPSGVSIRIHEISQWFRKNGLKVKVLDKLGKEVIRKPNLFYALISTKDSSISYQITKQKTPDQKLIIDLYTPLFLEKEISFSKLNPKHYLERQKQKLTVKNILRAGSHFIVANKRQKKYWVKTASDLGIRIKKNNISVIPTGSPMLSVVKSQLSNASPEPSRRVILWFGGIYPWMNPLPLIEAFSKVAPKYPDWKLRILGGFHPKTGYKKLNQKVINKAQQIISSNQLEVIPWQLSNNLGQCLADVSFAVHLAKQTPEDYYAHRVRLLTLLGAEIPVVTNGHDLISNLLVKEKAGDKINLNFQRIEDHLKFLMDSPRKVTQFSKNAPKIEETYVQNELDTLTLSRVFY